ncbi:MULTISPECIES: cyclopropane-fatty-acyl-phospholipid synthase family protein [unclassified Guyparkeria]|uniref:SAM-dependent methyltransferase n=1 Tax=unclassified Guyparkeria TaxID=2626246 RepID=UPI0007335C60|nr:MULTISPECIES: cyclopropane-fatty-acyl-phospholipid synthase family protein [unclassified Guyparkeria]KTG16947.1 cyclopropane-fatty-acyl-phospholipid synthase [Guyparkeria sp. XI15]OAE85981.1 cyclopropane-fatty-acyl-phospholipid synthase [Guyparkeria sp. WRN-7]
MPTVQTRNLGTLSGAAPAAQRQNERPLALAARWVNHFLADIRIGRVQVTTDDGGAAEFVGVEHPELSASWHLHHPARLFSRIARLGDIGIAEGFIHGDFTTDDLTALLEIGARNFEAIGDDLRPGFWTRLGHRIQHALRANHRRGSRRNIAAHYDLGNDFYRLWLDESMTYSAAIFGSPDEPLEDAQQRKYDRLLDRLETTPGDRILEVGCGWGGLAERAARRGLTVDGLTLSTEQLAYGHERLARAGLADRARLHLTDYRDQAGQFDHLVSIEMFEAVGERYWPTYFQTVRDRLKPGGRAAIQVITIDEAAFETYRREPDFIQLYIFPGGMLPSIERFHAEAKAAGLHVRETHRFGQDYARTLSRWRERFDTAEDELEAMGFDHAFRQTWRYYLAYCEAGFLAGRIDVAQVILERP